ncbi:hypothetical protein GCM10022255_056170 [Dactylosporangium darangshiense]|uniref:Leucine rich repeat variant n=1 Tax=Dactylosporangium darangshiense TaxID=579108 RepID=A0ABP8DE63_9ACTN
MAGLNTDACDVRSERQEILLALAANPALLAEHIDVLIATADPEVLQELALEQRLSSAQLTALSARGHRAVQLALIESGNLPAGQVSRDDPWALLAGIDRADASADWLPLLASWPDAQVRLALGASIMKRDRADIAELLAGDDDCAVAARATELYDLPELLARRLYQRTEACVRVALAGRPHAPAQLLAELMSTGGLSALEPCPHSTDLATALRDLRLAAAGNHATPVEAILPFITELDPAMALAVAHRRDLPAATYAKLVALNEPQITGMVASNSATPVGLLHRLYEQDAGRWRRNVLDNAATPIHLVLEHNRVTGTPHRIMFRKDRDELLALATDPSPAVRLIAAGSHQLPLDVRATLLDDPDPAVAKFALLSIDVTADQIRAFAARHGPRVFTSLAGHPCCPPDVLLAIARDPQSPREAVTEVAWHEAAPPAALRICYRHPASTVPLATNPATPPDILAELATHPDPHVVLEVARNTSLPPDAAWHILRGNTDGPVCVARPL